METIYKEITNHPGYRIGDDGTVWSCQNNRWGISDNWRKLTPNINKVTSGYTRQIIHLGRGVGKTRYIHQLVLEVFIGKCPSGYEVCHRDGNAMNNHLTNLYWGTRADNMKDKLRHKRHYNTKLTANQIIAIRQKQNIPVSQHSLAILYNVSQSTIHSILAGKTYTHIR